MREFVIKKLYIPLHSVRDGRAKYSGCCISCIDACYTYTTVIHCNEFRTVSVRIHYAVLIATPEPL